jgi:hypothetical protein
MKTEKILECNDIDNYFVNRTAIAQKIKELTNRVVSI